MSGLAEDIADLHLTDREREELDALLTVGLPIWMPMSDGSGELTPQAQAYNSLADELYFGGAAGGGKSDLLVGLSLTQHINSILFRREYKQSRALIERMAEILKTRDGFNGTDKIWRLHGRMVEFGACQHVGDEQDFQGRPHDLIGFDELPHFTLGQYLFLTTWLRTTKPGQRCRIVGAGNPPTDGEGEWVIDHWAPWINDQYAGTMALAGELRFFARLGDDFEEFEDATPIAHKGETVHPKSRTFIPSNVDDNAYLAKTEYKATLQALPEPLRSQMMRGDFLAGRGDADFQVYPTAWVDAAMERWKVRGKPKGVPQTALGVDPAGGGKDQTVIAPRYGEFVDELKVVPGSETPTGQEVVGLVMSILLPGSQANVDANGLGASAFHILEGNGVPCAALTGHSPSLARDRSGSLGFANKRAEWHWGLREALDPSNGEEVCLPPDRELRADLLAVRWKVVSKGIAIRDKKELKTVLKRSPDRGDGVIYAFAEDGPGVRGVSQASRRECDLRDLDRARAEAEYHPFNSEYR